MLVKDISAVLLAAGRSRRMGAFKPLLPFGDKTVVAQCVDSLRSAGAEDIVVVVGHRADEIRDTLKNANVKFALNPDPDTPMGQSIACGVRQVDDDARAVLLGLVDHPAVPGETIKAIISEWQAGHRLVQPEHGGRGGHPVLIDLVFRDELLDLDATEGLRGFFAAHREAVRRLPVDSPYVARDMDTWEDYLRLYEEVFGTRPQQN